MFTEMSLPTIQTMFGTFAASAAPKR